jgi:methylaspartate mutase epsilon subunit
MTENKGYFHHFIERHRASRQVIVQPRMGFSTTLKMRRGLCAVRDFEELSIGTLTLDSKTRLRLFNEAAEAVRRRDPLNGYPIVTHGAVATRKLLAGVQGVDFPVQVRHGSPLPHEVFKVSRAAGIDAIEGGPISYCLPYGRVPLAECVRAWGDCAGFWAAAGEEDGAVNHLETFGGCMLGQLCPPGLLVVISALEGLFFISRGLRSVSVSHAQGTNSDQDIGGVLALRRLAGELFGATPWHVVLYTWMGLFPESERGARRIIEESARVAAVSGAARLIVKTTAEAHQIPTLADNLRAMRWSSDAAAAAIGQPPSDDAVAAGEEIYRQAKCITEAVLNLSPDVGQAIVKAFKKGLLDVPFCIHPDNRNEARPYLDERSGFVGWSDIGRVPVAGDRPSTRARGFDSSALLRVLSYNQRKYDGGT